MPKEIVHSKGAPKPIAPYSHGTIGGGFVFISGQGPTDPTTGITPTNVKEQARQVMLNIKTILESAGGNMDDIVKCTVLLRNMNDYKEVNEVYGTFFKQGQAPARTCCQAALPRGYSQLVEIEAIAYIGETKR